MFRSRVFGPPDTFHVVLEYGCSAPAPGSSRQKIRLPVSAATLEFEWTSTEPEQQVVERFVQRRSKLLQDNQQETVRLHCSWEPVVHAASFPQQRLNVQLKVASDAPVLRSIHFARTSSSGSASESLLAALLQHLDLSGVWKLKGCEGACSFWATCTAPAGWLSLHSLNLSSCGLSALPSAVGQLSSLKILRLNQNKLTSLPAELGDLLELEVLSVNNNQLLTLPAELRRCSHLRELHLEHNRLVTPLLDLTHATALASLQLYGNPLEYLPELAPAVGLRSVSLANVRILADSAYNRWDVEVSAPSSSYTSMVIGSRTHKLQPLFNLVFRRSSIQHPLLAGALGRLIEDPSNLELLVREDVALQQLVLASMATNPLVVEQAVKVIAAAGMYVGAAKRLVKHNVVQAITDLTYSHDKTLQLSGLRVLSSLSAGACEGEVPTEGLMPTQLLDRLLQLIKEQHTPQEVRCAAIHALGNSAFDAHNRRRYLQSPGLMQLLVALAAAPDSPKDSSSSNDKNEEQRQRMRMRHSSCFQSTPTPALHGLAASCQGKQPAASDHELSAAASPVTQAAGDKMAPAVDTKQQVETVLPQRSDSPSPVIVDGNSRTSSSQNTVLAVAEPTVDAGSRDVSTGLMIVEASSPKGGSNAASTAAGSATAAAAAGLSAVAGAVSAAKSMARAAVSAASPGNARSSDGGGLVAPAAADTGMPASEALAAAAGAAAAVAAAPQAAAALEGTSAGSSANLGAAGSPAASIGADNVDKLLPKKRKKFGLVHDAVKLQAIRLLAILGHNEQVRIALGQPPIRGRGLRVLAMDGGGMKGMAMVELLRQLERRTGAPIWTQFDVIGGTSTGGLLAVAIGLLRHSLDDCQDIYTKLGNKVFHQSSASSQEDASWRESLYRMYATSSANMRVAVYGAKHDAAPYEELLRKFCAVQELGCASDRLIDTSVLGGPKVFVVATLASSRPAAPFAFRNYEVPDEAGPAAAALAACAGSCKHHVWEAVRASSAAPYFLDDFLTPDGKRFQDGATTANNPAVIALQQARLLHPQLPVDCLVSLGCGSEPVTDRSKGLSAVIDTGAVLLESACGVDRVHEALAATMPMVPGCRYFRFNAVDPRCAMELDDIKPESWRKLLAATSEYCSQPHIAQQFDQLAHLLTAGQTPDSRGQLPHTARLPRQPRSSSVQHHRQDVHIQRTQQQLADHPQQHATFAFNSQASHLSQGPRIKSASPLGTALDSTEHHSSDQWQQDAAEQAGPAFHKQRDLSDHRSDGISINEPLAAPKLMYNRGVLLVEAPRNIAASAVAAAAAAGSATVTLLRQHQQQELVGRLLAATLPQQLLHTCDVSALTASHTGDHQQQHQHVRQDSRIASAAAGCTSPRLAQLSQQQHQLPPPAAGISVNPRVSGGTPSVSPKSSSWLDWLPWQGAANSSEPQAEVAADVVTSPASPMGGGAQPTGVMLAVRSEPNFRTSTPTGSAPTQQQQHDGRQQLQQRQRSPSPGTPVSPARSVLSYSSSPGHYVSHLAPPLPRTNLTSAIEHTELQSSGAATTASSANGLGEPQVSIGWPAVDRLETPVPARVQQHHHHPQRQHYDTSLMDDFSGGSLVAAALRNALSAGAGAGVGVLHLALQWSPAGLVCGWRQEITAVVEPGPVAADLLACIRAHPISTTLQEVIGTTGPLVPTVDGGVLAVLAQQQVLAPAGSKQRTGGTSGCGANSKAADVFLTSWILQLTYPDDHRLLGEQEMYSLLSQLQQLIVVSSGWLPPAVIQILLRGGAGAVVTAKDAERLNGVDAQDVAEFFDVFYQYLLQEGCDVNLALQGAAEAVPEIGADVYQCYQSL